MQKEITLTRRIRVAREVRDRTTGGGQKPAQPVSRALPSDTRRENSIDSCVCVLAVCHVCEIFFAGDVFPPALRPSPVAVLRTRPLKWILR